MVKTAFKMLLVLLLIVGILGTVAVVSADRSSPDPCDDGLPGCFTVGGSLLGGVSTDDLCDDGRPGC